MVLKTLLCLALVIGAFLIYVALTPSDFKVERSIAVNAPSEAIFPHFNNPKKFEVWNPWSKADPNIKMTFSGPDEGVGATASWVGNAQAGEGNMAIVESVPSEKIRVQLNFLEPFAGTNYGEYTFRPDGSSTNVTWTMSGKMSFIPKVFCALFTNIDKMMGGTFEKGLAQMKAIVEAEVKSK